MKFIKFLLNYIKNLFRKNKILKETSTNNVEVLYINYKSKIIPICFYYSNDKFTFTVDTELCMKSNIDVNEFIVYTSKLLKKELNIN